MGPGDAAPRPHNACIFTLVDASVLALPTRQHVMPLSDTYPPFNGSQDVTFYLYTQNNPVTPEFIKLDDDSTSPSFNPKNPTRLAIHGGRTSVQSILRFREGYLSTGAELNVVLVDWSGLAAAEESVGVLSAVQVGDYVGQLLNHLVSARGLDPDDLVILGHSMGGHVAAIAGNRLGGGLASEVVALDPASDIFDAFPLENQLDASDAKFVQVIHTHGGGLGALESRGHADFFPNGGSLQPGCSNGQLRPALRSS
ncbi:hypothetical protein R5R35_014602 [Gryllus longicercus]|uniref:Lipase domain-containing protein n=1 Tax=Gryllus longicercus TaxID=2509291 RepID=A0AAN9V7Q3_9ORTH